jgi:hypothetical protein
VVLPSPDGTLLATGSQKEVRRYWQPRVQQRAKKQAATATGIVIETRARFGFTAALPWRTTSLAGSGSSPGLPWK